MSAHPTIRTAFAVASIALAAPPLAWMAACSPAQGLMRAPVFARCAAAGVGGCDEMTNSIVQFAEGDTEVARQQLWEVGAKNSPEKLRAFAAALLELGANPGAESYAEAMVQASSVLEIQAERLAKASPAAAASATSTASAAKNAAASDASPSASTRSSGAPSAESPSSPAGSADEHGAPARAELSLPTVMTADTDPARLEGGTAAPGASPAKVVCAPLNVYSNASLSAVCIKAIEGPFVVTDLRAGPNCGDDLFVAAGASTTPRWSILFRPSDRPAIHGAHLAVKAGEFLFVGAQAAAPAKVSADARCSVLWSGFRPYSGRRGRPEHGQVPRDLGF